MQQISKNSNIIRNKICIVGTGAVGLLYGGFLVDASLNNNNNDNNNNNNNISFVTRSSDYNILKTNGYNIKSKTYGNLHLPSTVFNNYIINNNNNNNNNKFDWIILSTKTNSLLSNDLPILLSNLSHENTKILCLMNGLNVEDYITKYNIFKKENINGGMAFVCSNKLYTNNNSNIFIDHSYYGSILLGNYMNDITMLKECKELFQNSVLYNDVSVTNCLLSSRWKKLAWNIPFNGLSIALGGIPTSFISKNQYLRQYSYNIMSDVIDLANIDITKYSSSKKNECINKIETIANMYKLTDSMGDYKTSGCLDLINNREIEYEFMFHSVYKKLQEHSDNNNKFPHLLSLLQTVSAINHMAIEKRNKKSNWNTNYLF